MRNHHLFSILLIFLSAACVDRINLDIGVASSNIVIQGYISDQPGPYTVTLSRAYDIESKLSTKIALTAKQVIIMDNQGNLEKLLSVEHGVYQTNPNGIRGIVGNVYTLRVELFDGKIYESTPDTLLAGGRVDSVFYNFIEKKAVDGTSSYGFDIFFNSTAGLRGSNHFLWKFTGTYQIETNPKLHREKCPGGFNCPSPLSSCGCPDPLPCSGYILKPQTVYQLEYVKPCECCTCWVDIYNDIPIISDKQLIEDGRFMAIKATYVPITQYTFMYKMRAEVSQYSLTSNSFRFWKAIKDQKNAIGSLFQPVSGKIPTNFIQLSGEESSAYGLFYATQINSRAIYIKRDAIPNQRIIPQGVPYPFVNKREDGSCLDFPYSTNIKPLYWVD